MRCAHLLFAPPALRFGLSAFEGIVSRTHISSSSAAATPPGSPAGGRLAGAKRSAFSNAGSPGEFHSPPTAPSVERLGAAFQRQPAVARIERLRNPGLRLSYPHDVAPRFRWLSTPRLRSLQLSLRAAAISAQKGATRHSRGSTPSGRSAAAMAWQSPSDRDDAAFARRPWRRAIVRAAFPQRDGWRITGSRPAVARDSRRAIP